MCVLSVILCQCQSYFVLDFFSVFVFSLSYFFFPVFFLPFLFLLLFLFMFLTSFPTFFNFAFFLPSIFAFHSVPLELFVKNKHDLTTGQGVSFHQTRTLSCPITPSEPLPTTRSITVASVFVPSHQLLNLDRHTSTQHHLFPSSTPHSSLFLAFSFSHSLSLRTPHESPFFR